MSVYAYLHMTQLVHQQLDLLETVSTKEALRSLLRGGGLTPTQLRLVIAHASGYTVDELRLYVPYAQYQLIAAYKAIGEATGYTNEAFLQKYAHIVKGAHKIMPVLCAHMDKLLEDLHAFE
jgi:hypothetical protein